MSDGVPVLFDPATDQWHVGPRSLIAGVRDEAPLVRIDGQLVVWSGATTQRFAGGGSGCCNPLIDSGEAYTPQPRGESAAVLLA